MKPELQVRHLHTNREFVEAVRLQKEIWGFDEIELLPVRLFVVASKIGGQVIGAYDGERMVGFCIAIPGVKAGGRCFLHSHMLGILDGYRDAGLGRRMKLVQREEALGRGLQLVEWTFDPLELKNAWFNMQRLGAVVRRFVFNQYGTTTSHLHGGLPTDRCVAEWWLASPRVEAVLAGDRPDCGPVEARIEIPANIGDLRRQDPPAAREIQRRASEQFAANFASGLAVTGVERTPEAGIYLFTRDAWWGGPRTGNE